MKFSMAEIFRIVMTAGLLVALIVLIKPCSKSVSTFVMGFGSGAGSAKGSGAGSAQVDPYEHLTPGMSDDEVRLAIERAKLKNLVAAGSAGSAGSTGSAGSAGSAAAGSHAKPPGLGLGSGALSPGRMPRGEIAPTAAQTASPR
jgi:hypothetical protein